MMKPDRPSNEVERLEALESYGIMDTLPEEDFDDITRIASEICQTPISLITLIDKDRQWFKSKQGLKVSETPREHAFCAHAILDPQDIMIVPNPRDDVRFQDNPLVTGDPHILFYAGVPLVNPEGFALGTLCTIDQKVRQLNEQQLGSLKALANQVVAQLELRRKVREVNESRAALQESNQALETFAYNASHDLKNPLNNVLGLLDMLKKALPDDTSDNVLQIIYHLDTSTVRMKEMITSLLEFSRISSISAQHKEPVDVKELLNEIIESTKVPSDFTFHYDQLLPVVTTSRTALHQIMLNLLTNAIKYNDKEQGQVIIRGSENEKHYCFQVQDNGPGIRPENHDTIFGMFSTLGYRDRYNQPGTGLGLYIVKKLVIKMGGRIQVQSTPREGSTFEFTLAKMPDLPPPE